MSVIVARALPTSRRFETGAPPHPVRGAGRGLCPGKPYKKSAKIVGDVMGNYHPHGDSAIYDALARMTQDWSCACR